MIAPKFMPLIVKQIVRNRTRTFLTVAGVATAMFLFIAVQAMHRGVMITTQQNAEDNLLIVYRQDRYCPFTSQLPQYYQQRITEIPGVVSVIPMRIIVNNCRTSLDVVTFRGVPDDDFLKHMAPTMDVIDGSIAEWERRSDAAIVGETLARRRGFKAGDSFDAAGVRVYVAGIVRSDEPQDQNVAYVKLDFLQQTVDRKLGTVTQFNVRVDDPKRMNEIAAAIDEMFATSEFPTATRSDKAFMAQAADEMIELVSFARYVGWASLAAVLALVGNAIVLSVQERIKEHAILQTLGFRGGLVGRLVVTEGLMLGLLGGAVGTVAAVLVVEWGQFSLSMDGLSIPIEVSSQLVIAGLLISMTLGVIGGLIPGWQASRRPIAGCFRAV